MAVVSTSIHAAVNDMMADAGRSVDALSASITEIFKPGTELMQLVNSSKLTFEDFNTLNFPKRDLELVVTFDNPAWPLAQVQVRERGYHKFDPSNPNPTAPPTKQWFLVVDGKERGQPYSVQGMATFHAEQLHKRLVAGLIADQRTTQPNFGRF